MKPISEMTDQELVEAWFVEAHGWEIVDYMDRESWEYPAYPCRDIFLPNGEERDDTQLPDILDSESAFNQWVNAYMEGRGWRLSVWASPVGQVMWLLDAPDSTPAPERAKSVDPKNNRRFRAAVEGALQIIREGE